MQGQANKTYKKPFIIVLCVTVLCFCLFIGSTLAWLFVSVVHEENDAVKIGTVTFEIYNGSYLMTEGQELTFNGTTAIRTLDVKVRNTGTVDAIIRATISIYTKDGNGNKVPLIIVDGDPSNSGECNITSTGWINDYKDNALSGYSYYNSKIEPYVLRRGTRNADGTTTVTTSDVSARAVSTITQVRLSETQKTETIYMTIRIDGVAYSGNIYKKIEDGEDDNGVYGIPVEAYPFGTKENLPSGWTAWR